MPLKVILFGLLFASSITSLHFSLLKYDLKNTIHRSLFAFII